MESNQEEVLHAQIASGSVSFTANKLHDIDEDAGVDPNANANANAEPKDDGKDDGKDNAHVDTKADGESHPALVPATGCSTLSIPQTSVISRLLTLFEL